MTKLRFVPAILAVVLAACGSNPASPSGDGNTGVSTLTFVGTARMGHQPLSGVVVTAAGQPVGSTDASGQIKLSKSIQVGADLQATLSGFLPRHTKVPASGRIIMRPVVVNTTFTTEMYNGGVKFPAGDFHVQLPNGADMNVWKSVTAQVSATAKRAGRTAKVVIGGSGNTINILLGSQVDPGNGATTHLDPGNIITGGTTGFRNTEFLNYPPLMRIELYHYFGLSDVASYPGALNPNHSYNLPDLTDDEFDAFWDTAESKPGTGSPDDDSFVS